jgi:hypothetical protein
MIILYIVIPLMFITLIGVWYCAKYSVERELYMQQINSELNPNLTRRRSVDTLPPYTQELEEVVIKEGLPSYEDTQITTPNT